MDWNEVAAFLYEFWIMRSVKWLCVLMVMVFANGCGAIRSMEQWKCDHWGMCHFAAPRPGVYSPMAVQPGYAPATYAPAAAMPQGYVGGPNMATGSMAPPTSPMVMPPSNGHCSSCSK